MPTISKEQQLSKIREMVRKIVRERMIDEMSTTANIDGYQTPYAFGKPGDEKKKNKKIASLMGYTVVKESHFKVGDKVKMSHGGVGVVKSLDKEYGADDEKYYGIELPNGDVMKHSPNELVSINEKTYPSFADPLEGFPIEYKELLKKLQRSNDSDERTKLISKMNAIRKNIKLKPLTNESINENRWLDLKNEESTAQAKIGRGISNINKQLKEMERFLNWYGKIKNESGVDNKSYWKRTNSHIYSIQERLLKLDQKIRQISE